MFQRTSCKKCTILKTLKIHTDTTGTVQINESLGKVSKIVFPVFPVICRYYCVLWCHQCTVGYSDFHNLMGFIRKKMTNNILKNVCLKSFKISIKFCFVLIPIFKFCEEKVVRSY